MDGDHGKFDQIGRRTLDDRVDRGSLGEVPLPTGIRADLADRPTSTENSTNIPGPSAIRQYPVEEFLDARIPLKIGIYERRRRVPLDPQLLGQPERALAVDHPEIDRLRVAPHRRRHLLQRDAR